MGVISYKPIEQIANKIIFMSLIGLSYHCATIITFGIAYQWLIIGQSKAEKKKLSPITVLVKSNKENKNVFILHAIIYLFSNKVCFNLQGIVLFA